MYDYPELNRSLEDLASQASVYRPTAFWADASAQIAHELRYHGIEHLRSLPSAPFYFAPLYGPPTSGFMPDQIDAIRQWFRMQYSDSRKPMLALDQFLAGETQAITDYRVLIAADDNSRLPYLHHFTESATGRPLERFEFEGRCFSRSALNYLLGLSLLKRHMGGEVPKIVLEVGGGFGTLGEILAKSGIGDLRYIDIDIPPMSFIAQTYLCEVLGAGNVATYDQTREQLQIDIGTLPLASALCSWQIERLLGTVDLFVNFISFQEMEPAVVQNYLSHVVRLDAKWVLLRNLREGMMVKKGTETYGVEVPILSEDYVRMLPGYILVARNVLPFGYRTVDGFHSELLLLKRKD